MILTDEELKKLVAETDDARLKKRLAIVKLITKPYIKTAQQIMDEVA